MTTNFKTISRRIAAGLALVAAVNSPVLAATATTSLSVSATVLQSCIVVALPLAFGNYDPTSSSPTDGSTTVTVTCTSGTTYNVGLGVGAGTGASTATRKMTSGANTLNYSLYSDTGRATVWGTSIGSNTVAGTATGLPQALNVYGRIPAQQTALMGAYTDTVTVTVTY